MAAGVIAGVTLLFGIPVLAFSFLPANTPDQEKTMKTVRTIGGILTGVGTIALATTMYARKQNLK